MQRLLARGVLQAKLTINQPGDVYEQEADRVADAVMRMPESGNIQTPGVSSRTTRGIQRVCTECEQELQRSPMHIQRACSRCQAQSNIDPEPDRNLQAKEAPGSMPEIAAATSAQICAAQGGGESLPQTERKFFESRFGYDFSGVRIHTNNPAAESAQQVEALAYTYGSNIVFGAGQYQPGTTVGRRLMAHELAHVVQQSGGHGRKPTTGLFSSSNRSVGDDRSGQRAQPPQVGLAPFSVQRMGDPKEKPKSMPCPIATSSSATPVLTSVLFPISSNVLSPMAIAELSAVAAEWNAVPFRQSRVRIDGFASTDGTQSLNWTLSCNRATAVASELENPSGGSPGIPSGFLDIFAQGETSEFSADLEPNRRATISASLPIPVIPAAGCASPGAARELDLQPVFLRTGPGDTAPTGGSWTRRFNEANLIWGKLGITFHDLGAVTLDTPLKTTGANDAEANAVAALRAGPGVEVFLVDNDMTSVGGASTARGCDAAGNVVLSDRGTSDTILAHELGHIMGLGHPTDPAPSNPGDANTIMEGSGSHSAPNPTRNTIGNFNKILCPPGSATTCLHPDP